jgi:hypothetical protein
MVRVVSLLVVRMLHRPVAGTPSSGWHTVQSPVWRRVASYQAQPRGQLPACTASIGYLCFCFASLPRRGLAESEAAATLLSRWHGVSSSPFGDGNSVH